MTGKTLGHYQILEQLGAGGMGVVYKARDTHLDRPVAVKVLPPERVADAERKQRFIREAKAASALNHPNIITIYDIDEADGVLFIAMEYIAGRTLDDLSRRGLKLAETLKYAVQVADGLAKAHSAGIVHRDLKPSNVMVNQDGLVKILDFGLAKLTANDEEERDNAATRTLGQLTEEGAVLGTLSYMSPEQAEGRRIDARSDIFSFGSVLYEMVTGERAFQGETRVSTLAAIVSRDPKPVTGVPHDLAKILTRCLRKDLDRRFQHMDDIKIALQEVKEESESGKLGPAAAVPRPSRRWQWLALPAVALALVGVYLAGRRTAPESTPAWKVTPVTTDPGHETDPALSPDGNQVAFSRDGDIYVKLIDGGPPLRLTTDPGPDASPCWSPDGRRLAFRRA